MWLQTRGGGCVQARIGLAPLHAKVHTINAIRMRLAWCNSLLEPSLQTSSTPSFFLVVLSTLARVAVAVAPRWRCVRLPDRRRNDASTTSCTATQRRVRQRTPGAAAAIDQGDAAAVRAGPAAARAGAREASARAAPGHHADGHWRERRADRRGVSIAQGPHFAAGVESRAMNQKQRRMTG